jgi:hypothetical protein
MYGSGKPAAAPAPPVPHDSASNAVIMPSAETPALIFAAADGRFPVTRCSSLRSSVSFTGAPACFASRAQISPSGPSCSLLPKPPPMYWQMTRTLVCGISRPLAKLSRAELTPWVETQAVSLSPSHSHTTPCDSMQTCVMTWVAYVCSSVTVAALNPAARSPASCAFP